MASVSPNQENSVLDIAIVSSIVVITISWLLWRIKKSTEGTLPLPPGPWGLPLVGNLPFLEPELHRYFIKLAKIYGPIFRLRLGNKLCMVLNSPQVVKEVLKDNDITFANHDKLSGANLITYGWNDIVWTPYGADWRRLRRVAVHDFLNNTTLEAGRTFRRREVRRMVKDMHGKVGKQLKIGEEITEAIFNTMTSMLWGGTLKGAKGNNIAAEFRQVLGEITELLGQPNVSDLFPVLAPFDLQGVERRMKGLVAWFDRMFVALLDERIELNKLTADTETKDFLDIMLQLMEDKDPKSHLTMDNIKALLLDLAIGGSETTSTTSEWFMTELMTHPEVAKKIQDELEAVVGKNNVVEESHLSQMRYLEATVKEVLRLHPGLPLLIPHMPSKTCAVGRYTIPKGTRVFVNVWAIQRDPSLWENPLEFQPERWFDVKNANVDLIGSDLRFLPFGAGRRICAGFSFAERMLTFVFASLLHSFDWQLPQGTKLDHDEKFGLVLKKANPLIVVAKPRLSDAKLYAA